MLSSWCKTLWCHWTSSLKPNSPFFWRLNSLFPMLYSCRLSSSSTHSLWWWPMTPLHEGGHGDPLDTFQEGHHHHVFRHSQTCDSSSTLLHSTLCWVLCWKRSLQSWASAHLLNVRKGAYIITNNMADITTLSQFNCNLMQKMDKFMQHLLYSMKHQLRNL